MPYYPSDDSEGVPYEITSMDEKLVSDYTGMSFFEIEELRIDIFMQLRKDAYVYKLSQTSEGRQYLKDCYRLTQTEPDREALRKKFGGGGTNGK